MNDANGTESLTPTLTTLREAALGKADPVCSTVVDELLEAQLAARA